MRRVAASAWKSWSYSISQMDSRYNPGTAQDRDLVDDGPGATGLDRRHHAPVLVLRAQELAAARRTNNQRPAARCRRGLRPKPGSKLLHGQPPAAGLSC
jgi:hypothetical protein